MKRSEVAELLARVVAFDRRTIGDSDVLAWYEVLSDIDYQDALAAVVGHFKISQEWLMPVHVRTGAKALRRERLSRVVDHVPDADPDIPLDYIHALREGRSRVASGEVQRDMRCIDGTFRKVSR